ncbi:hypothetical protein HMPREF3218_0201309 [Prevotella bivia]|nr:hypothetical protein HMPREF3218_0201309 [Prevotella bivia]
MSHATSKIAWLLFFLFEQAGDQRKEAKESRKSYFANIGKATLI